MAYSHYTLNLGPAHQDEPLSEDLGEFGVWPDDLDKTPAAQRRVVMLELPLRWLGFTDEWQTFHTPMHTEIRVRSADCGAGCRCAAEFEVL